jgi:hypothetical protein
MFSSSAFADDDIVVLNEREVSIDLTKYNIQSNSYKKSAMKALIGRNWDIVAVGKTTVTGMLSAKEYLSRVEIDYSKAPIIQMKYIDKDKEENFSYLTNLKRDMLDKLLSCN